jgi:hypothetical protein
MKNTLQILDFLVEEIMEEDVETPEMEKRYYVGGDEAENNKSMLLKANVIHMEH